MENHTLSFLSLIISNSVTKFKGRGPSEKMPPVLILDRLRNENGRDELTQERKLVFFRISVCSLVSCHLSVGRGQPRLMKFYRVCALPQHTIHAIIWNFPPSHPA